jgi:tRNA threonylcarbamoyladenosine biosynthesis protein TsaE
VSVFLPSESGALVCHLPDPEATEALGRVLAVVLQPGMLVTLDGPLGSGKTALVRAMLRALGFSGRVRSPTYTLVEEYELTVGSICHFDFYRFAESTEADDAGFREHFGGAAICLVEWPQRAGGWLPPADLALHWLPAAQGRTVAVQAAPGVRLPRDLPGVGRA